MNESLINLIHAILRPPPCIQPKTLGLRVAGVSRGGLVGRGRGGACGLAGEEDGRRPYGAEDGVHRPCTAGEH